MRWVRRRVEPVRVLAGVLLLGIVAMHGWGLHGSTHYGSTQHGAAEPNGHAAAVAVANEQLVGAPVAAPVQVAATMHACSDCTGSVHDAGAGIAGLCLAVLIAVVALAWAMRRVDHGWLLRELQRLPRPAAATRDRSPPDLVRLCVSRC